LKGSFEGIFTPEFSHPTEKPGFTRKSKEYVLQKRQMCEESYPVKKKGGYTKNGGHKPQKTEDPLC